MYLPRSLCLWLSISALCLQFGNCFIAFTPASTHGIFAALAVPLELPHRNVFVSYNFEANYNSPDNWEKWTIFQNGPIESEEIEESRKRNHKAKSEASDENEEQQEGEETEAVEEEEQETTTTMPTEEPSRERRELLSRSNIYHILMDKFQRSGFAGEPCLLRLICEINAAELSEGNGVLGSLMHVIFSPSTSQPEQLPLRFYQAEHDGWQDHCHYYESGCGRSLLHLISEPFEEIFRRIQSNEM
ncbi:uncharacterized protein LOC117566574 [Drosophila albomicans]|uniref:Uncharacterized protein LOC117566574 n=1 Tax=Drosophila albomicans TaxID=7291 RepID=A0A6P8XX77_DROAB|nr:uncharacterized protein LOC117566574 [Drosophila albomicans]